jgi:hypothetical protein
MGEEFLEIEDSGLIAPKAWEQQPGEPDNRYQAFRLYCELDITSDDPEKRRGCRQVADRIGKAKVTVEKWMAAHNWTARANMYDLEVKQGLDVDFRIGNRMEARDQAISAGSEELLAMEELFRKAVLYYKAPETEVTAKDFSMLTRAWKDLESVRRTHVGLPIRYEFERVPEDPTADLKESYVIRQHGKKSSQ